MKLNFTKEQTIKVIKAYYKMYENRDVNIMINTFKGCEGLYETPCVNVKITISNKIQLLNEDVLVEAILDKSEVTNIFKTILREENYQVESLNYNAIFKQEDERYNDSYTTTCFNGIEIQVKSLAKENRSELIYSKKII